MQITNNIRITCSVCGSDLPVECAVGREYERNMWIYRVAPCRECRKLLDAEQSECEHTFQQIPGYECTKCGFKTL